VRGIAYDRFGDLDVLTLRDDLPEPISAQLAEPVDAVLDIVGGDTLADAVTVR